MAWVQMAVTLAGVSSALLSLQFIAHKSTPLEEAITVISPRTVDITTFVMVPISLAMIVYAMYVFLIRSKQMRSCQVSGTGDLVMI